MSDATETTQTEEEANAEFAALCVIDRVEDAINSIPFSPEAIEGIHFLSLMIRQEYWLGRAMTLAEMKAHAFALVSVKHGGQDLASVSVADLTIVQAEDGHLCVGWSSGDNDPIRIFYERSKGYFRLRDVFALANEALDSKV